MTPAPIPTVTLASTDIFAVIDVASLNLRSGPGVSFSILGKVSAGERYRVLGQSSSGIWFELDTPAGVGWVAARFVQIEGDVARVPVTREDPSPIAPLAVTPLPQVTNTPIAPDSPPAPAPPTAAATPIAPPAPTESPTPIAPPVVRPSPTPTRAP